MDYICGDRPAKEGGADDVTRLIKGRDFTRFL